MDSTEDFSFPRISDCNHPHPIDSPPLWTPSSPPSPYQDFTEEKLISQGQSQSLKEEHKMDLLWEDFNEELSSSSTTGIAPAASSSREMVGEYRCGSTTTALTVAKRNGVALFSNRNYFKPGMVVVMKVLKKLFFFNDHQGKQPKRRRTVW